jgi:GT2 family glycosyltransferase
MTSPFAPLRVGEVELSAWTTKTPAVDPETGRKYSRALVLLRLHGQPLGLVEAHSPIADAGWSELWSDIWAAFGPSINEHLSGDGFPPVSGPLGMQLPRGGAPRCLEYRRELVANGPFASVIVATRDRPEQIRACLGALLRTTYAHYEIIVVDNAPSSEATADLVSTLAEDVPHLHYVREDRAGASRARNRGLDLARGEIAAFVDDDVVIDPDWLTELACAFRSDDKVACVTGLVLPFQIETAAQLWFEQYGGFCKGFVRREYQLDTATDDRLFPLAAGRFGTGANTAFRTSVLRSLGGFDITLGPGTPTLGAEDLDLYVRTLLEGHRLVYEPRALVWHVHRGDYADLQRQIHVWGLSFSAFVTKHLIQRPSLARRLLSNIPEAIRRTWTLRTPRGRAARAGYPAVLTTPRYPADLRLTEMRAYLGGPFAYVRSQLSRPDRPESG